MQNQCGEPIAGAGFSLEGRDHGYRAAGWTDENGTACLEVPASEPLGEDFDMDGLGGETFWVDIQVDPPSGSTVRIKDVENPTYAGDNTGCDAPESCAPLSEIIKDFSACD